MLLLQNAAKFTKESSDLKSIYLTFKRPVLEQSAPVWQSSLSQENISDLERIQKSAVRLIMGKRHVNYESSLLKLNILKLTERREDLSLNFAKRTTMNKKIRHMFPLRKEIRLSKRRKTEKYVVRKARTNRLKNSAIPYLQNLLNKNHNENKLCQPC